VYFVVVDGKKDMVQVEMVISSALALCLFDKTSDLEPIYTHYKSVLISSVIVFFISSYFVPCLFSFMLRCGPRFKSFRIHNSFKAAKYFLSSHFLMDISSSNVTTKAVNTCDKND